MKCDCGCEFEPVIEYQHKLICGDCTDDEMVERLVQDEKVNITITDPPYNVGFEYDGKTINDEKTAEKYKQFSHDWFGLSRSVSDKQIVTPGCNNLALWLRWFDAYHWAPWTKINSMTNGRISRFWCWEPVLFFGEHWGKSRHSDIFDYPIGEQGNVANHPCPKPLKMWEDLIENYSETSDMIYDPFLGSGTTIIACENSNRKCRAIEISPAYVGVSLERYCVMTNRTPELI